MSYAIVRGLIGLVAKLFGSIRIVGLEHVPTSGAFVLAPVHRSNIDFALTALLTKRPMRYMGKDSIWKSRALGRFVSMLGAFPCTVAPPTGSRCGPARRSSRAAPRW